MKTLSFDYEYWKYLPNLFQDHFNEMYDGIKDKVVTYNQTIYGRTTEVKKMSCIFTHEKYSGNNFGKHADAKSKGFDYNDTPAYPWSEAPQILLDIKNIISEIFNENWDYVLVHLYRNRNDFIGYHCDKEAFITPVCSISFGCTRIFEIKEKGKKSDIPDFSYQLSSGDVFYMKSPIFVDEKINGKIQKVKQSGCQEKYLHRIPKMKLKDLKDVLEENNVDTQNIKRTFIEYEKLAEENSVNLKRINLTFRQFQ
jgi:hypothetical protein